MLKANALPGFVCALGILGASLLLTVLGASRQHVAARTTENLPVFERAAAQSANQGWFTTTVAAVEGATSLALDDADQPHIAYVEQATGAPAYAAWNGASWVTQTVNAAAWASGISLAFDAQDGYRPYVAYRDFKSWPSRLEVAYLTGTVWITATVEQQANSGLSPSLAVQNRWVYLSYIHVDGAITRTLYYVKFSPWPGSWPPTPVSIDGLGSGGLGGSNVSSLALNPVDGDPAISYYAHGSLRYAGLYNSHWFTQTVDSSADVGKFSSLAFSSAGSPRISYLDGDADDLKYAYWRTGLPGQWVLQTVDGDGSAVGWYTSLSLNGNGLPRISYRDLTNTALKFAAMQPDGIWRTETVDGGYAAYTSLALDGADHAHISYGDSINKKLKYARQLFTVYLPLVLRGG